MEMYWYIVVFLFGAIIGSFLNVVIYRLHTGRSLNGRSHCMSCGNTLAWYELLPVISYISLRGACRKCSAYIPVRYLIVELLTAVSFLGLFQMFAHDLVLFGLHALLAAILILVAFYDLRHTIIPDELALGVGGVAALMLVYRYLEGLPLIGVVHTVFIALVGACFFALLWYMSKGRWIGFGDAKLALPLGVIAGGANVFSMIVLSFWVGAGISLVLLGLQWIMKKGKTSLRIPGGELTIKSEVPFAPFLILGFLLAYLFHVDVFALTSIFVFYPV